MQSNKSLVAPCVGCNVVGDHILRNLAARHPDLQTREQAAETLALTSSLNSLRAAQAETNRTARRGLRDARGGGTGLAALLATADRTIYDAENRQRLPGTEVRREGDPPTGDAAVDEAYDGLGDTFDLYESVYDRNSIDGNGMPLSATVHFGLDFNNALWDGQRMIFGDGDGVIFERFTKSLDVIGHELTHGVIEHEAGLIYWSQPGALNESVADVFGSLVKQYTRNQTADDADWLIGDDLFTPNVNGEAIRSMKAPGTAYDDPVIGKDPQPAHMSDYVRGLADNGGVHINSGIPNHAFYLAATALGGHAWESAGLIWYETLLSPFLRRGASFRLFAWLTIATARRLFLRGSPEEKAVRDAWQAVGVLS